MNSKRDAATQLRLKGYTYPEIERALGIGRSTLSGWFGRLKLPLKARERISERKRENLIEFRKRASAWHRKNKLDRLAVLHDSAKKSVDQIDPDDKQIKEIALAFLYLGEGAKGDQTSMGNSDPTILRFFIKAVEDLFDVRVEKLKCELHLRADQDTEATKTYWSKELNIPVNQFVYTYKDKRTLGSTTFPNYHGVCVVRCSRVDIQRRLLYTAKLYSEKIMRL